VSSRALSSHQARAQKEWVLPPRLQLVNLHAMDLIRHCVHH
jgi:hypothetical protein